MTCQSFRGITHSAPELPDMAGNAMVFSPMESKTVTVDICFHAVLMRQFNIREPRP